MTKEELSAIVRAVEAVELPEHLVTQAMVAMVAGPDAKSTLLAQLTTDAASHSKFTGKDLQDFVSACFLKAMLASVGRIEPK